MPNIYKEEDQYYIFENGVYRLYDVSVKSNTIVLMPTDTYKESLNNPVEYTYQELRNELLNK